MSRRVAQPVVRIGPRIDRRAFKKPPRNIVLRDIIVDDMALGVRVVRGTLWPSGEHFAAALWAISGRPGCDRILQVVYTDRGAYRTGLDVYGLYATLAPSLR